MWLPFLQMQLVSVISIENLLTIRQPELKRGKDPNHDRYHIPIPKNTIVWFPLSSTQNRYKETAFNLQAHAV